LVMGSYGNLKITTPEDLDVARLLASRQEAARK
jgi:2-C-methyl-D-erythritol 4-phosphate cytidylyltransferase